MTGNSIMTVDWEEIHKRLAEGAERGGKGCQGTPEDVERILRERARLLARVPSRHGPEESVPVVEFLLGPYRYGIEARWIREVLPLREITPIPSTPSFIAGLMNVRGRLVAVTDLAVLFDLPPSELGGGSVIVIYADTMEGGIAVDGIIGVRSLPLEEVQPVVEGKVPKRDYIKGFTRDRMAIVDVEAFLTDSRLIVNEEVE